MSSPSDPLPVPERPTGLPGVAGAAVALVRWPGEEDRLASLRTAGRPRLLLVEGSAAPPLPADELEDWIRVPAPELDMRARLDGLERRLEGHATVRPAIDDGVLRVGREWVSLPPVDLRLASVLVEGFGIVVSRDALTRAGWPGNPPARNALDVHVLRLRRRLEPIGLVIRTVRSRGYALEHADPGR